MNFTSIKTFAKQINLKRISVPIVNFVGRDADHFIHSMCFNVDLQICLERDVFRSPCVSASTPLTLPILQPHAPLSSLYGFTVASTWLSPGLRAQNQWNHCRDTEERADLVRDAEASGLCVSSSSHGGGARLGRRISSTSLSQLEAGGSTHITP